MKHHIQNRKVIISFILCFLCSLSSYFYFKFGVNTTKLEDSKVHFSSQAISSKFTEIPSVKEDQQFPRIVNKILTEYRPDLAARFQSTVDRNLSASDQEVIELVQDMMDKPSTHMIKLSLPLQHTPQSKAITPYLEQKRLINGGFFIECGALDGERSSNTIYLEQKYGWKGLLIEADPYFYTQLMGKNRKSWSINACLSPSNQIQWLNFKEHSRGEGQLAFASDTTRKVPCFPFESYMAALGRSTLDFFSLDIEGFETPVINSINYTKFTVKAWTIEYPKPGDTELVQLMTGPKMGYRVLAKVHDKSMFYARDVLFVKD